MIFCFVTSSISVKMGIFDTSDLLKKDFHVKYVEFKF